MKMRSDKMPQHSTMRLYMRGMRLLSGYIPGLLTAITLHSLILSTAPYIMVWLVSRIVGELDGERDPQTLWMWAGIAVAAEALLMIVGGILKHWKEAKWERLYRCVDTLLTDKLLSLDHADADDRHTRDLLAHVKEHMSALGFGLVQIPGIYQNMLCGIVGTIVAACLTHRVFVYPIPDAAGVFAWMNSPFCAVVFTVALIFTVVTSLRLSQNARRILDQKTNDVVTLDRLYYTFYNAMFDPSKAADIRLYRQDALIARYLEETDRAFFDKKGLKRRLTNGAGGVLRAFSTGPAVVWLGMICLFVVVKALAGAFGFGPMIFYIGALTILSADLEKWCWSFEQLSINAPYLETVYAFLDIPHRMYQGSLTTEKRADRDYEIEFRRVSFRYPSQTQYALRNVSVTLRKGERLAIVGENGSGKSTFVKLLCRLYDPDEGEILLNGIDIRKYRYDEYIAVISVVFQDFQLLSQPLGDNVAGAAVYEKERVARCLEAVGLGDRLREWERGMATPMNDRTVENGEPLSLGDAQKIAIARALYKDAPFIILDEPTAALDPVAEAEIYESFDRIVDDRTAIYVSHRLSSCRFCEEILVFDDGRIVQRGTHEELVLQTNGKYHELWNAQAQYYQ